MAYKNSAKSHFESLFDNWAYILCLFEAKLTTEASASIYDAIVKRFVNDMRTIFGVEASKNAKELSWFVTPYIHILCSHSSLMMAKNKGLWLFSQQGFEHAHKVHKQIFREHTSKGGGRTRVDPNLQIMQRVVLRMMYLLETLGFTVISDPTLLDNFVTITEKRPEWVVDINDEPLVQPTESDEQPTTPTSVIVDSKGKQVAKKVAKKEPNGTSKHSPKKKDYSIFAKIAPMFKVQPTYFQNEKQLHESKQQTLEQLQKKPKLDGSFTTAMDKVEILQDRKRESNDLIEVQKSKNEESSAKTFTQQPQTSGIDSFVTTVSQESTSTKRTKLETQNQSTQIGNN
jgi:hypothetical protein